MASDPLREVLQKVAYERRDQIANLELQLKTTFDPIHQDDIQKQLSQLRKELAAAEQALEQRSAPPTPQPQQPIQPVQTQAPIPQPSPADAQILQTEIPVTAPKGPSKAALEAQIRELQTQLLDAAQVVEKGGANPNPMDVKHLQDVRQKLQSAMHQINVPDPALEVGELPPPPTPAQLSEADNLIKRSMLEKRRGNSRGAGDLLRQAADVAPGSPTVLEALGDDIMERGQPKPAAEIYAKALRIQPNNPNLERKYAIAVGRSKAAMTVEEALQASLGDGPLSAAEAANQRIASIFSFFIPGGGQFVLGDYVKGAIYFFSWVIMLLWLSLAKDQWKDLVDSIAGKKAGFNPMILIPIIGTLGLGIAAAFTCKKPRQFEFPDTKGKGNRPTPPVDLPFE